MKMPNTKRNPITGRMERNDFLPHIGHDCGIFQIINTITGYIITRPAKDIRSVLQQHFYALKNGKHNDIKLQKLYNEYGESSFDALVLETCSHGDLESLKYKYKKDIKYNHRQSNPIIGDFDAKKSGIYKIENIVTNDFYIGGSANIKERLTAHFSDLRRGRHKNKVFQAIFTKYGENCFKTTVLAECPQEYLDKLERWFIENLKPSLNMGKTTYGKNGKDLSEGEVGRIFELQNEGYSCGKIAEILEIASHRVRYVLSGTYYKHLGYTRNEAFACKRNDFTVEDIGKIKWLFPFCGCNKIADFYNSTREKIDFVIKCPKYNNIAPTAALKELYSVGLRPYPSIIIQKDLENNNIKLWKEIKIIEQFMGIPRKNISDACSRKNHVHNGYNWQRASVDDIKWVVNQLPDEKKNDPQAVFDFRLGD